jgi:hypothetical protein
MELFLLQDYVRLIMISEGDGAPCELHPVRNSRAPLSKPEQNLTLPPPTHWPLPLFWTDFLPLFSPGDW